MSAPIILAIKKSPLVLYRPLHRLHNYISVIVWLICLAYLLRYIFHNAQKVGLQELGPRITLKLRSLQSGTFDSKHGEYVWLHKVSHT